MSPKGSCWNSAFLAAPSVLQRMGVVREALLHINNFFTLLRCETPGVPLYEGWQCVISRMRGAVAACASHLLTRGNVSFCELGEKKII